MLQHCFCYSQPDASYRHLTMIGAMITILLLLFDPFLQQVVVYPDRFVTSDMAATIVRAQKYIAQTEEDLPLPSVVEMSMKVFTKETPMRRYVYTNSIARLLSTMASSTLAIKQM